MRLHKPPTVLHNGCGAIALATVTGRTPEEFYSHGYYQDGRYQGMYVAKLHEVLCEVFPDKVTVTWPAAEPLTSVLKPRGRGIAVIQRGDETHAVSYDGLMVYDAFTSGRWMWVYDYPGRKWTIHRLLKLEA